ncbi:hypothetical protein [Chitinophaga tropicalis]|uniref:Uncharacterized protein n=1 Tax=Chitinophaga tropicalis TaxID=2683588 RepID=A0A7K1UE75_9BACT|nr:hypothetical protein [Chitinophaga tropicalis]MVT12643.1 hypothetical protein [Chitinophaga tropicalis]
MKDPRAIVDKRLKKQVEKMMEGGMDKKEIIKVFKDGGGLTKVGIYIWNSENTATRKLVNKDFDFSKIKKITDVGIQKIMLAHLQQFDEDSELAFSPDGLDILNANITQLNGGKSRKPIYKVRIFEPQGSKFMVGERGSKMKKYVEAAKGSNLFFAIYVDEDGKRSYETIPLNIVIERKKQGLLPVPESKDGYRLLFYLSPNDLVYVPSLEEISMGIMNNFDMKRTSRIYKVVSFYDNRIFFLRNDIATVIKDKIEFSVQNKQERSIEGSNIKEVCIKLKVGRLGNLINNV